MNLQPTAPGARVTADGVHYCVWAPQQEVGIEVFPNGGSQTRLIALRPDPQGFHRGVDERGEAGDRYLVQLNGAQRFPCPASRWQPEGVNGVSLVVSAADFPWSDQAWQRPPFRDLVIYELHVGTFTPEGTFRGVLAKLPYLESLGVNAIELMPIADFPGARNWGYDGVRLFAPARVYGHPDDLRALVDAAHARGLAVILDVVYNHFGPDGNFLREFSPDYFEHRHHTPWGEAINFGSRPVRDFYVANIDYWMEDFHIDGFRLDATHEIFDDSSRHILAELAELVHQRHGYIIAEDERNEGRIVASPEEDGYGLDAVWADDFHHTVEVALIDASMYHRDFAGELSELADALENGWIYRGQKLASKGIERGTPCAHLPPERFVFCISNHDQAGNRAFGDRLNHLVSPETYRAASALLCLVPYTPLLFMGQEWGASAPFQFFTDHEPELGRLVEEGRGRDIRRFPVFEKALVERDIPSPQARETFERSKLDWAESTQEGHATCLRLYRDALRLRREHPAFRPSDRAHTHVAELKCEVLAIRATAGSDDWLLLCDLRGGHSGSLPDEEFCRLTDGRSWRRQFSSNDPQFGGPDSVSFDESSGKLVFQIPEVLVLQAQ
ncbi:MAG: maltooligosyltrehalose trehalohydrolase [Chthoniobacter sp.]|jgi:maltooligosyltrehalose trehalohydrolase|nr:maltooligosyltrehalose trehalohydrolase [Chthoniobacter sp.]